MPPVANPDRQVAAIKAWRADTVDDLQRWFNPLPARSQAVLDDVVQQVRRQPRPTREVFMNESQRAACGDDLAPVSHALEQGCDFAFVIVPAARYSRPELTLLHWLIGELTVNAFGGTSYASP
jgi:hypothetical protein